MSESEDDTGRLGAALAHALSPGVVVALIGDLGAGKTRLVQACATAMGIPRSDVNSPTFVLINEYPASIPVYHFDAYRIRDDDEFLELGPDEYFESGGVTFVEWADRVADCIPADCLEIRCEVIGETSRRYTITPRTERDDQMIAAIREATG